MHVGVGVQITLGAEGAEQGLIDLVAKTFAASSGPEEAALVARLVRGLVEDTPPEDTRIFVARSDGHLTGVGIFSRLSYPLDGRCVFLLSPLAVSPAHQCKGVGQALLCFALLALQAEGVAFALTYGAPAYYRRVGFHPIDEALAKPPLPLSMPQGWLGKRLGATDWPLTGPARCVLALNTPALW